MTKPIFLFTLLSILSSTSAQSVSCRYNFDGWWGYQCILTINNPNGFDSFTSVGGTHLSGYSNSDVRIVITDSNSGTSSIIPRIICDSFFNLGAIRIINNLNIQILTENAFSGCRRIELIRISWNPISSIHPSIFRQNFDVQTIQLIDLFVATLPEDLFLTNTRLSNIYFNGFNFPLILPPNIFRNSTAVTDLASFVNNMPVWRAEWTQGLVNLRTLRFSFNSYSEIPRNALMSNVLTSIDIENTNIRVLDFFNFPTISSVESVFASNTLIEAIDFNLIDRAVKLVRFWVQECVCVNRNYWPVPEIRDEMIRELEPCFEAFDRRVLDFITSTPGLYFNSIRKQQITVKIQASSDAIIRFSSEPDGSGSNFEVRLGVEGNMESCIFESDVRRTCSTTPGLLNISQMRTFNISWNGGSVFVVHENPILFHFLSYPFAVRFVGVGTISGATAAWNIQQV